MPNYTEAEAYNNSIKTIVTNQDGTGSHLVQNAPRRGVRTVLSANLSAASAVQVCAANAGRLEIRLYGVGQNVYLGKDSTVSATNYTDLIPANAVVFIDDKSSDAFWAVLAAGTATLKGCEVA